MRWRLPILLPLLILSAATRSPAEGQEVAHMKHEGGVHALAFSADGRYLATQGHDFSARHWEVPSGREVVRMTPHIVGMGAGGIARGGTFGLAFSPDGRYLATGNFDGTTRVWEVGSGRIIAQITSTYKFAFSPNGTYLGTGSLDGAIRLCEATTGREVARMNHDGAVYDIAFSPDGRYLATASNDRTARVWETVSGREVSRMNHGAIVFRIAFSPDGRNVATWAYEDTVRVWEALTGREVARMPGIKVLAFSPDGRYLAAGGDSCGAVLVSEVATGREIARVKHKHPWMSKLCGPPSIAFSPDGRYLATGYHEDPAARVSDAASGQEFARMKHESGVQALAFSPDGRYLATADQGGTVKLWPWRHAGPDSGKVETPLRGSQDTTPTPGIPSPQPTWEAKLPEVQVPPTLKADEFEMSGARQAILSATSVKIFGELGNVVPTGPGDRFDPNPAYAKKLVEKVIRKWGRFRLVEDSTEADLVLVIVEGLNEMTITVDDGRETVRILVDRLRVFKGGEFSKASTKLLWDSGEIEYGEMTNTFLLRMPATAAAIRFRKFVEALEKERGK